MVLLSLLNNMMRIRAVELEIAKRYSENKIRCPTHLSVGQEAVAVGVASVLNIDDLVVSGHRAHAHYLAKSGNLYRMIAEIYGKSTGCSKGFGGSMHLIDQEVGFMGSTAIVGGTVPIGVGLALGLSLDNSNRLSCIFMGDAVAETGVFFESASFAALKKLPVLFICENNLYSVYTNIKNRQPNNRSIFKMVSNIGVNSYWADGNDVTKVREITLEAINKIRNGEGPQFIEFETYRWLEHCGPNYDNQLGYRTQIEFAKWLKRDPLNNYIEKLMSLKLVDTDYIYKKENEIIDEIKIAFEKAIDDPFPENNNLTLNVYSTKF